MTIQFLPQLGLLSNATPSSGQGEGRAIKSHTFLLSLFLVLASILYESIAMFLCIYTYQNNAAITPFSQAVSFIQESENISYALV